MEKSLPKGWVETELGEVSIVSSGYGFPTKYQGYLDYDIPFYKVGDISENVKKGQVFLEESNNYINDTILKEIKGKLFQAGSIVFAKIGEAIRLNRRSILSKDSVVDNNVMSITYNQGVNNKYGFYYFQTLKLIDLSAGNAVPSIRKSTVEAIPFPLPPLPEQERIVAKLDRLFAQHEKIKQALDRIPQLLKAFRQQVLTQAVTGKLTEQWREGKDLEEWTEEKAQDCCLKVQSGGTPKGSKFTLTGIPFLKVYNIVNNKIDFDSEPQYVSDEIHNTQIKKSIAYPNDVIMNIVGPPLNKVAILTDQYPEWNLNQAITIFRVKEYLDYKFLYYFFCEGTSVKSLGHDLRGVVGQANISLSQCRNFDIPIPPLQEQQEIVRRVESLVVKADTIEDRYRELKKKVDNLPQAILHKAFRGELVPQLPTDGDAKDLLAEIMALKKEATGKKNKT